MHAQQKTFLTCLGVAMLQTFGAGAYAQTLTEQDKRVSDQAIAADYRAYEATQGRIKSLNDGGRRVADYHLAKAQCWLDVSFHEYTRNDRSVFTQQALDESVKLIAGMEAKKSALDLGSETALINNAAKLRPDLWANADALKKSEGFSCSAQKVACAEVELVHAGNEANQQQWRHAKPYVQIAEDSLIEAKISATACARKSAANIGPATSAPGMTPLPPMTIPTAAASVVPPAVATLVVAAPPAAATSQTSLAAPKTVVDPVQLHAKVLFNFDKRDINNAVAATKSTLDEVVTMIRAQNLEIKKISITGHADRLMIAKDKGEYNAKLARDRANSVKTYLMQRGIDSKLIAIDAKADSDQLVGCSGTFKSPAEQEACMLANRRVEVNIDAVRRVTGN